MKKVTVYKFIEKDGICIKTEKTTDISLYWIDRILGKVTVKGSKKEFEKIVIKNRHFDVDGTYLVERKHLTRDVVCHFITSYYNGERSVQNHPYTMDLFDDELLNDLDIVVLTTKWFAIGDNRLYDHYRTFRKDKVNDELIRALKENDIKQLEDYEYHNRRLTKQKIVWAKA